MKETDCGSRGICSARTPGNFDVASVEPPAGAAALSGHEEAAAVSDSSGTTVLGVSALVHHICGSVGSAATAANLRRACKQTFASLDWFDLMWCARQDIVKVHAAIKQHGAKTVTCHRIKGQISGSLQNVWSCPPLLKWVVLQAAKQGDAELLGAVLGKHAGQQKVKQQPATMQQQQSAGIEDTAITLHYTPLEQQPGHQEQQPQQQRGQQEQEQQQEQQQEQLQKPAGADPARVPLLRSALLKQVEVSHDLGYPIPFHIVSVPITERVSYQFSRGNVIADPEEAFLWLSEVAAEAAASSNNCQLLQHMLQEGWFGETPVVNVAAKQQLVPALYAAAAAGDVEAGKVLLSYCPGLLNYTLGPIPAEARPRCHTMKFCNAANREVLRYSWEQLLPPVYKLHKTGFSGIKLKRSIARQLLKTLCSYEQRHQPELVQMLLDLGVVSCDEEVQYERSKGACPILAVAVAERNAGAVAVLVAAGAVLPTHHGSAEHQRPLRQG